MTKTALLSSALFLLAPVPAGFAADAGPITIGVPVGLSGANSVVAPSVVPTLYSGSSRRLARASRPGQPAE